MSTLKNYHEHRVKSPEVKIIDNQAVKFSTIVVHTFRLGDVEDPEIYAAEPIWRWQESDSGKWVMEHAVETPAYHSQLDSYQWGYTYAITARLSEQDITFFRLKFETYKEK